MKSLVSKIPAEIHAKVNSSLAKRTVLDSDSKAATQRSTIEANSNVKRNHSKIRIGTKAEMEAIEMKMRIEAKIKCVVSACEKLPKVPVKKENDVGDLWQFLLDIDNNREKVKLERVQRKREYCKLNQRKYRAQLRQKEMELPHMVVHLKMEIVRLEKLKKNLHIEMSREMEMEKKFKWISIDAFFRYAVYEKSKDVVAVLQQHFMSDCSINGVRNNDYLQLLAFTNSTLDVRYSEYTPVYADKDVLVAESICVLNTPNSREDWKILYPQMYDTLADLLCKKTLHIPLTWTFSFTTVQKHEYMIQKLNVQCNLAMLIQQCNVPTHLLKSAMDILTETLNSLQIYH